MTPTQIETMARQQYNASQDNFYSPAELQNYMYMAQMEFCKYTGMLKGKFETTSVANQKEYDLPDYTISIKRLEYDGVKVSPIDMRENDDIEILNTATATTDQPAFYYQWNNSFYLSPTPNDAKTITAWVYKRPQPVTTTSVIEIPEEYHLDIVNFVTYKMAMKDENAVAAREYKAMWIQAMTEARKLERRKLRGDSFTSVKDVDRLAVTRFGTV